MGDCCGRQRFTAEGQGAKGDGVADDRAALQAAIDAVWRAGGGELHLAHGATYRCVIDEAVPDLGLIVQDDVEIVGNGATINLECTGGVYGVRLRYRSAIKDCRVATTLSASPGEQGIWHSCISVGDASGLGGTVGSVSSFHNVSGWRIEDVTLANARVGALGIVLYGGVNNGVIDGVTMGDSATLYGVVHMDWAFVGTITTSGLTPAEVAASINTSRTNFDAGTAYTTHPHDIAVRNITVGTLSRIREHGGSIPIRISGGHNITIENVVIDGCTIAGFYQHAGDAGYEFAPGAVKPFRHQRITVRNFTVKDANKGHGVFADCDADNIATANNLLNVSSIVGTFDDGETITGGTSGVTANIVIDGVGPSWLAVRHRSGTFTAAETLTGGTSGATATFGSLAYAAPLLEPVQRADIVLDNCQTYSDSADSIAGFRVQRIIGVTLINPRATGHLQGILIEEGGDEVRIKGGLVYSNRREGLYAGHGGDRPQLLTVEGLRSFQNDTSAASLGNIGLENCDDVTIRDCALGKATETALYGVRAAGTVSGLIVEDNRVQAGANGYSFGSSGEYLILRRFIGNSCASGVTTRLTGVEIVTEDTVLGTDGIARRHCFATRAALSSDVTPAGGGTWVAGERIRYLFDAAAGAEGSICTTSGTAGTLNGGGTTGSITSGTALLTVNSVTGLGAGAMITIAGVSGVKTVVSILGLVVTIDSNASATVAGAAVAYSPPVFKKYGSIAA